jgi:signal transduction histidine kinase
MIGQLRRVGWPVFLMIALIVALGVVQYRWLGELGAAARDRMARDLRVATTSATTAVDLALARLATTLETAPGDSGALAEALTRWEADHPELAGLVGAVGSDVRWHRRPGARVLLPAPVPRPSAGSAVRLDSLFLIDSLLPRLTASVARSAEIRVVAAVARRQGAGEPMLASANPIPPGPPDVIAPFLAGSGATRIVFIGSTQSAGPVDPSQAISWSAEGAAAAAPPARDGWELWAWHGAGSLERAAASVRRGNLVLGFGLMALLAGVGGSTLIGLRRNQRLADDRATILAGISHEIRTPLAVARSAADNLKSGIITTDSSVAEYGALIDGQLERLEHTVTNALAFARSADPDHRRDEWVDLAAIARGIAAELPAAARVRVEAPGPVRCRADGRAIEMAVRNLITNALEYSPDVTPVDVTVGREGRDAVLSVADRGPGVAPAERETIFAPFARGTVGLASRQGGLGLGLAIAARIARLHGGTVQLAARAESGSVFTLRLPGAT